MCHDDALRVFVSYSHDSRDHAKHVADLSAQLRQDGIDCQIDQYYVRPEEGWPNWMERQIREADTVLVICTEIYRERFERKQSSQTGRGVRWESLLVKNITYRGESLTQKLLPVMFNPEDEKHIPDVLFGLDHVIVDPRELHSDPGYKNLVRKIRRETEEPVPPVVPQRRAPMQPMPVLDDFFRSEPDELRCEFHRLPITRVKEFLGREEVLQQLDDAWADDKINVISLVAFGGVGKTAVVNRWLAKMATKNYQGASRGYGWSAYSQGSKERVTSADGFIDDALRFFGTDEDVREFFGTDVPDARRPGKRATRLAHLIREQPTLLVLDGIESLQHPPGDNEGFINDIALRTLVRVLRDRNQGLCVITTRVPVADLSEWEGDSEGGTCRRIDLENLSPTEAVDLLHSLEVRGTEQECKQASEDFGGHALALTLLGTFLVDASAGDIRRRSEIGPLVHNVSQGGHARRVMDSYEDWLGPGPEQNVLRMLGLFDRPAEGEAISALRNPPIAGLTDQLNEEAWTRALTRLRRARLVADADEERSDILDAHPLVREHFGQQLKEEHAEVWREGHKRLHDYYSRIPIDETDTTEGMVLLYRAVAHGCEAGLHSTVFAETYWRRIQRGDIGYSHRVLGLFNSDLAALWGFFETDWSHPVTGLNREEQARVPGLAGSRLRAVGRLKEALKPTQESLKRYEHICHWSSAALQARHLSELCLVFGELRESVKWAENAVDLAIKGGNNYQHYVALAVRGTAYHHYGDRDKAERSFREAEDVLRDTSRVKLNQLYTLWGYRFCDFLLDSGCEQYKEVKDRAAAMEKQRSSEAQSVDEEGGLGILRTALEGLVTAKAMFLQEQHSPTPNWSNVEKKVDEACQEIVAHERKDFLPLGQFLRAALHREMGEFEEAKAILDETSRIADRAGMRLHEADCQLEFARLHLAWCRRSRQRQEHEEAEKQHKGAIACWTKAQELVSEIGYGRRKGEIEELEKQLGETPR